MSIERRSVTFDGQFDHVDVLRFVVGDHAQVRAFVVFARGEDLQVVKVVVVTELVLVVVDELVVGAEAEPEDVDGLGALHARFESRGFAAARGGVFRSHEELRIGDVRIHAEAIVVAGRLHVRETAVRCRRQRFGVRFVVRRSTERAGRVVLDEEIGG